MLLLSASVSLFKAASCIQVKKDHRVQVDNLEDLVQLVLQEDVVKMVVLDPQVFQAGVDLVDLMAVREARVNVDSRENLDHLVA